jgi:hypothetical protein
MAAYKLVPNCTVEDAVGLARNNMTAFYGEPWWKMQWDLPLERIIEMATQRLPRNLLGDRQIKRHQKVVDTSNGDIVGYCRWILPESQANSWLEAQTPDVSAEDAARFQEAFAAQPWRTRPETDDSDELVTAQIRKHRPSGPYISEIPSPCFHVWDTRFC